MTCPICHVPLSGAPRFCPSCGYALATTDAATQLSGADATRLATEATRLAPEAGVTRMATHGPTPSVHAAKLPPSSASGWLSSSGSVDHGRFAPGTVLEGRYRVLGLLGRGGMGEVYRADDLRLGQQVALKFLPSALAHDPVRLAQFHNEIRTARQVSHANVCRMYDIGEIDGQLFLTMEYVDGEDLSLLLRRIGRLPEDKALEIARQICAGLAAAHDRGVLHRDLKPANIMLDGAGKVRIMDFSLAAVGDVTDIRAGTPAYMAPEQLEGREVTARSDIYALGLVLYELFTGRRAFDAKTLADLVAQHQSQAITSPTEIVKTLDTAIERAILRCLDVDPQRRPASPLAVAVALPGGDPLAAALAAGETPSPEMIAAAGTESAAVSPVSGALWMAAVVALLVLATALVGRSGLIARLPLQKPAPVLVDRAQQIRALLGSTSPEVDRASGFSYDQAYLRWALKNGRGDAHWAELSSGRPAALRFWYRSSPIPLVPRNYVGSITTSDPPVQVNGMTLVVLDTLGQLVRYEAAPAQVEAAPATSTPGDWDKLFAAAGLDRATFKEAAPTRTPPGFADDRRAWEGPLGAASIPVHVEAASYRGQPVYFDIIAPWTLATREASGQDDPQTGNAILIFSLLVGAAIAARANLRSGRADRRGAMRLATFMFFVIASMWLTDSHVSLSALKDEQQRLFLRIGLGLFVAGAMYLIYLGLEPFVRRSWPTMLIGWSRLLSGRLRDPLVGRDVLFGTAAGLVLGLLAIAPFVLPTRVGLPEPIPILSDLSALLGTRQVLGTLMVAVNGALQNALISVFEYATIRAVLEWLLRVAGIGLAKMLGKTRDRFSIGRKTAERIFVILVVVGSAVGTAKWSDPVAQQLIVGGLAAATTLLTLIVLIRLGLLAAMFMSFASFLVANTPLTFDSAKIYSANVWLAVSLVIAFAAIGWWMARAGEPLLSRAK